MGIKIKDLEKKMTAALKEGLESVSSKSFLNELAQDGVDIIKKRTRLGYGVSKSGGSRFKLKKLSDSYVLQRQGKLGFWTNSKGIVVPINTLSGKELKQFRASKSARTQVKKNSAFLKEYNPKLSSKTSPKKSNLTSTGDMLDKGLGYRVSEDRIRIEMQDSENRKKAEFVSEDRPFMNFSKPEIKQLIKKVRDQVNKIFKKKLL